MSARRLVASLLFATLLASSGSCTKVTYEKSPQWSTREGRFENPPAWPRFPSVADFFRWRFSRPWHFADYTPKVVPNDGARLRQDREHLSITWIGHATLLLQGGGVSVLTDPVFSQRIGIFSRLAPPGVALKDLPPIDVVLISHNHYDHLDAASALALGPNVQYIVPLGLAGWFRERGLVRVIELDWWESRELQTRDGRTLRITLVPAQHWSRRGLFDERDSLWGGFVVDLPALSTTLPIAGPAAHGPRIYFAGDTGYPAAFTEIARRFPAIDYALLPIGAYEPRWFMAPQHMDPAAAARAFAELHAGTLVPMHFATFRLADEPMTDPPILLRQALGENLPKLKELALGESLWK